MKDGRDRDLVITENQCRPQVDSRLGKETTKRAHGAGVAFVIIMLNMSRIPS